MLTLMHKLSLLFMLLTSTIAFSQISDPDLDAIVVDLVYLADQYVSPAAEASSYQSSGGWYTSAKKKELWDLEISLQGNLLLIPNKSKNFLLNEDNLLNIKISGDATTASTPTALGGDDFVVLEGTIFGEVFEFDSPEGLNSSYVRHAQLQTSLGLWAGTTLIARFSPKIKINKTYYQTLGFGLNHNISQWIPKLNESSYSVSTLFTYSIYSVSDNFSEVSLSQAGNLNSVIVDGQSFMFNIVASKEVKKFNFSTAIGITSSKFEYKLGGTGVILGVLNRELKKLDKSKANFKADIGVDYSFGDFSANSMITFGSYTNLILGLNYNL